MRGGGDARRGPVPRQHLRCPAARRKGPAVGSAAGAIAGAPGWGRTRVEERAETRLVSRI